MTMRCFTVQLHIALASILGCLLMLLLALYMYMLVVVDPSLPERCSPPLAGIEDIHELRHLNCRWTFLIIFFFVILVRI